MMARPACMKRFHQRLILGRRASFAGQLNPR
jgi:hypothetical protein